ncbi:MAG TPA: alpha/beta hydrolase [Solirubrobacterales bacterium]|nr:alpha/beta hydrolase [Solirubrobacterales bacterium]
MAISEREKGQVEAANAGGKTPVVFIHGLWLLASSWQRWAELFEGAGYAPVLAEWPDDPATVAEARANPQVFAGKGVGQVADHIAELIGALDRKPAVVGHSFGGLMTQIVAGRGLCAASVAVDPAPFRGVLPLPLAAIRATWPVMHNPLNRSRAVTLTLEQFSYGWANALDAAEAKQLHEEFHVAAPGKPIFQAAMANVNPATEVKVDSRNPDRGPLLIFTGEKDHAVPPAMSNAAYGKQKRNQGVTELAEVPNRGHSLTIDSGWREIADRSLEFVKRFV